MSPMLPVSATTHAPRTILDLLGVIDEWDELQEQTRRVLKANVRTAAHLAAAAKARLDGRSVVPQRDDILLAAVPADPAFLNRYLYAFPAPVFRKTKHCLDLSVSGLRRVMRHAGLIDEYAFSTHLPGDSEWRRLLDRLEDKYCQTSLSTFAVWAHGQSIEPPRVSSQTLEAFETHVRNRTIHSEIPRLVRGVCKSWPKASELLESRLTLVAPSRRHSYTLDFADFSPEFQADKDAFEALLTGSKRKGPFRDGSPAPLRAKSVKSRLYSLRQAASAFVHTGRDITSLTCLADLLEIEVCKEILTFFWERGQDALTHPQLLPGEAFRFQPGVTAQTGSIATTLMKIARAHCKLHEKDPDAFKRFREIVRDLIPKRQASLSPQYRERLRQFDDPVMRAKLLHLPRRLMRFADGDVQPGDRCLRPMEAARLARLAAAIEILLHVPVRNGNLTTLRVGVHLRYGHGGLIRHLVLQPHETKNSYDGEWPIGPELATTLEWYIKGHRPLLNPCGEDWLFPAGFGKSGPISCSAMYHQIVRGVAEEIGAIVNPHFFRCLCARFILEQSPDALEDVRLMIGDKSLQVVLAHYNASRPDHAAKRTDATLRKLRTETAHHLVDFKRRRGRHAR